MTVPELIIRGQRVVLPETIAPRSVHIREERIVFVGNYNDVVPGCDVIEIDDDCVVMPGLVDTHVHINSPGRTEWEGFRTATLAAAAGGVCATAGSDAAAPATPTAQASATRRPIRRVPSASPAVPASRAPRLTSRSARC